MNISLVQMTKPTYFISKKGIQ